MFQFHNKLEIIINDKKYTFYNKMFSSVFEKIKNFERFNSMLAIGNGSTTNNDVTQKLTNHIKTVNLFTEIVQPDISKGTPYIKKSVILSGLSFDSNYITEAGLTCDNNDNPTIYNYVSLIDAENTNGVKIDKNSEILINFYIYLHFFNLSEGLLTSGNNPFILLLLGEGLSDNIFAVRGNCLIENKQTSREIPTYTTKYLCSLKTSESLDDNGNNVLSLSLTADIGFDKTYEIVFMVGDIPFARMNLQNYNEPVLLETNITPKESYILDIEDDVKEITTITNNSNNSLEENFYCKHYANDFGDKITLPFNNLFDYQTPRFLSKDGDKIFFVVDDYIYAYKNTNYQLQKLFSTNIILHQISKIISFENWVFVLTKEAPYFHCFTISNNSLIETNFEIPTENLQVFDKLYDIDVTISKNNVLMLSYIPTTNYHGVTLYYNLNATTNNFEYVTFIESEYEFSYMLSMYKNNFSDARVIFLKEGEYSYDCKIVTHYPDATVEDIYSVLCYYYTKNSKAVYTKNRAVITEKTTSPRLQLFYYPQMYEYELPLISDEDDDYISTNLLYLIQKRGSNYDIYNLVGYNTPTKFKNGFPPEINQSEIVDFEFLNDTILIFTNNPDENIIAYNLKETCMMVENVSSIETDYLVSYKKYDIVGSNNEGVIATFAIDIKLWYFLKK